MNVVAIWVAILQFLAAVALLLASVLGTPRLRWGRLAVAAFFGFSSLALTLIAVGWVGRSVYTVLACIAVSALALALWRAASRGARDSDAAAAADAFRLELRGIVDERKAGPRRKDEGA